MPLQANEKHLGYTIMVSDMVDYYVLNIFDGNEKMPLPNPPKPPLGGGVEGAVEEARRFIDEYEAQKS